MRIARPYQIECIEAIRAAYKAGRKGVVIEGFTGFGKGFVIASIAKSVMDKKGRVLVAVNRDNLCDQLRDSLIEQGMMPVLERGADKASPMSDCVVGSVQTMQKDRLKKWNPNHFRLVITDEIHFGAASTFKSMLSHFDGTYHLGLSATIERHDKKGLWKGYEECVFSMPLTKGIEEGWLVPFEFEELPVPISVGDELAEKKQFTQEDEETVFDAGNYLPRLFAEAASRATNDKSLFFWPNCDSSREASSYFNASGVESRHADGYMSKATLNETLEWFRSPGAKALHNADLYSYGFDAPFITLVGIMRISRSIPMLKQRLGRGTRPLCRVDDYPTAEGRRAAIAASAKPRCKVLDLMLQLGDVQNKFATATSLITEDEKEREFIEEERRKGKAFTMEQLEQKLRVKRETDKEEMLAKLAEDAANAAARRMRGNDIYIGDIINRTYANDRGEQPSEKQVAFMRSLGVPLNLSTVTITKLQASKIISRYVETKAKTKDQRELETG